MFNWKWDINQLIKLCSLGPFPEWVLYSHFLPSTWPEIVVITKLIHRQALQAGEGQGRKYQKETTAIFAQREKPRARHSSNSRWKLWLKDFLI